MGQNSSKKRTHSLGKGKNGNTATLPRANGDDANGSIEVHQDNDVSTNTGQEHVTPASPTSEASVLPSNAAGKKEKRKRFRVGFSLKRTPSGRWSRKRKTPTQNGTRPVSSSDQLKEEQTENPGRPQSLFLEELVINEDDNKIETVDLSDNENGKKTSANENKSTSKAPEKTKWTRGSHKKSSGNKKKKEKQSSKKDKKKKQKPGHDASEGTANTEEASIVQMTAATSTEKAAATTDEPSHVNVTAATSTENEADTTDEPSHVNVTTSMSTEKLLASSKEACHVNMATIELGRENETTVSEHVREVPMSGEQQEIDITAVAASIVAYTVKTAQERLRAESCHNKSSTSSTAHTTEPSSAGLSTSGTENMLIESVSLGDVAVEVGEEVTTTKSENAESAAKIAQDIIAEIMDKSSETIAEPTLDMDIGEESQNPVNAVNTTSEDTSVIATGNNDTFSQFESTNSEHSGTHCSFPIKTEDLIQNNNENVTSKDDATYEDIDKTEEINESEAVAKKTVESVIAAAIEVVHGERGYDDDKNAIEFKDDFEKSKSDLNKNNLKLEFEQETVKSNKNKTESVKTEEEDIPKKSETECKQMKVEEKSGDKHGNDKSKAETKIKVPKKLSHWFHKKDKQPKTVGEIEIKTPGGGEAAPVPDAGSLRHIPDSSQENTREFIDCSADLVPIESQPSSPLNSDNNITSLNISQNSSDMSNSTLLTSSPNSNEVSSPDYNEVSSPSVSVSPTSPNSDPCDKKTGSGFLKKISLGPRLRTAIFRTKSTGPSDDKGKSTLPNFTPPKPAESTDITPPPRKSRHQTPNKRSPVSSSTDTSLQSPLDSTLEFTGQPESTETDITIEDSGVADLTSPESYKSDFSYSNECKTDNVGGKTKESAAIINAACVTDAKFLTDNSVTTEEETQKDHVNESSHDNKDDIVPLPQESREETDVEESVVGYPSTDYFPSLDSPTLISTAVIILRSTSSEESATVPDNTPTRDINSDRTRQEDSEIVCNNSLTETADESCSSPASILLREHHNSSSFQSISEIPTSSDNQSRREVPERQVHNLCSYAGQTSLGPDVAQAKFENNNSQRSFKDTALFEYDEKQFQNNNPRVRTVAEYQIGTTDDLEDKTQKDTHKECHNDCSQVPKRSTNAKDINQFAADSQMSHPEVKESGILCINNSTIDKALDPTLHEDSSQVEQKLVFLAEKNTELQLQEAREKEQTVDAATTSLNVLSYGLNFSQIACCTDGVNATCGLKENGHLEANFAGKPEIVDDFLNGGGDSFQETSIQKGIDVNDHKGTNYEDCKSNSDVDKAEPIVTSMAYIKLQNWNLISSEDPNSCTSASTDASLKEEFSYFHE